jgi:putative addiction module component (TIGR02574 family)
LTRVACGVEILAMTNQALLAEILKLPPRERIDLLGEAWDAVAARPEDVPIPEWHIRELERRLSDPAPRYVSWEEVRARLRSTA